MTGLLVDVAGWAGAGALLLAYGLVSYGSLSARGTGFQLLNLSGAAGLLTNGIWHGAWPSAALNAVWLVMGAAALRRVRHQAERDRNASTRGRHAAEPSSARRAG